MNKKRGDDRWDHRLLMGEGGWDGGVYSFIQTYLMQQSSKEISNEECIGKDQCPKGHSLETNFDPSYFSYFTDIKYLIPVHLFFYPFNLIFESFFHNLNDAETNYYEYKNYKKINGCEILYHCFLRGSLLL